MSTRATDPEARAEHPDELTLAGWSEGRLLEFERDAVEAHLADCGACRALVGALASEEAPAAERARTLPWPALLAAAALIAFLVQLLLPDREPLELGPRMELALAGTRAATFSGVRAAPLATGELFVGVRLDAPGWIRLIALDRAGGVHEVPLDPEGATSARFAGGMDHVFGPYPTELEPGSGVAAILALTSNERLDWTALEGAGWSAELTPEEVTRLAAAFEARAALQLVR